jgi:hypothetical protein
MKMNDGGPEIGAGAKLGAVTPMSLNWQLPSGQRLAEFALKSGFLAPLMLGGALGGGRLKARAKKMDANQVSARFGRTAA